MRKWMKTLSIAFCSALVLAAVGFATGRRVAIDFDWNRSTGFKTVSVVGNPPGGLTARMITAQVKPRIASHFTGNGWRSARGRLDVIVWFRLFVIALDRSQEDWGITDPEFSALMSAAMRNDTAVITRMLTEGAEVNARDQRGRTALMYSCRNPDTLKVLLAAGADPNVKDRNGNTALMYAAWSCTYDSVTALLAAGANPNAKDNTGYTAADSSRCRDTVQKLLQPKTAK